MGRYRQIVEETNMKQKKLNLNSSESREIMGLELLAQISETFALFTDIYAATHGVNMETPAQEDEKKRKATVRKQLRKMAQDQKKDDEPIPDSEIPFASNE